MAASEPANQQASVCEPKTLFAPGDAGALGGPGQARPWCNEVSEQVPQHGDEGDVGGGHGVAVGEERKIAGADPGDSLALMWVRNALPAAAQKQRHQQMEFFVSVRGEDEGGQARLFDRDAQFFLHLTDDRLFGALALFDLTAGEFPKTRHTLSLGALRDQHAPVRVDQDTGGNENEGNRVHAQLR